MPKQKVTRAGLNGLEHGKDEIRHYGPMEYDGLHQPLPCGVAYLGDKRWRLPLGATIKHRADDNWLLTMPDGKVFHVWAEG